MAEKRLEVVFISLAQIESLDQRGIYADLLRVFVKNGHGVTILTPTSLEKGFASTRIEKQGYAVVKVPMIKMQKTNFVKKTIGLLTIDYLLSRACKKQLSKLNVDLLLYSTPPLNLVKTVQLIKKVNGARTYLLLKDIFPQCLVDLDVIKLNSLAFKLLKRKEEKLYSISDTIGCMSPANVDYIIKHNNIDEAKVELCPNSIMIDKRNIPEKIKAQLRVELGIPPHKRVFFYGGNLGIPQNIPFIIDVLRSNENNKDIFFLIIGDGTEYQKLLKYVEDHNPENVRLLKWVPKYEFDRLIYCADVGMIFLDERYTIPNFPSRLLSYLENRLPVLCSTDSATDIGTIAGFNKFGFFSKAGDLESFNRSLKQFMELEEQEIRQMGDNGYDFLLKNYLVEQSYQIIMKAQKDHRK